MIERGANIIEMPIGLLQRRYGEIDASLKEIKHSPDRRAELEFEFGCIILEMWCKHRDGEIEFISPEQSG